MVEFNGHGLVAFFQTLKTVSAAVAKYGKEYSTKIMEWIKDKVQSFTSWVVNKFKAFFIRTDLSK